MGIASLDAALSGLRTAQQQINVISNNVANVGTPGFSRKILPQSSQAILGVTVGVAPGTITRNVNLNLERDLWTQISSVEFQSVQETYLQRIEQYHGDPAKGLSIASEISELRDTFSILSDSPEDSFAQANVINQAQDVAEKINGLSDLITTQRNDVQSDITTTLDRINSLLEQIVDLNDQVKANLNLGRSTALLEDKRDDAIKELTGLMDISFFQRGDGVLVVQTNEGVEMASDVVTLLYFDQQPIAATTYYPENINGIYVGDPVEDPVSAVDITSRSPGGKLGGLLQLRDSTFPKQMAQLDELAHKMALRFEAQGLRLFTDASGVVPADTPPDPTTLPPTPVEYIGFSAQIQVNEDIIADRSLLQQGTYGGTLSAGSNEVIRRVIQYGFGDVEFQEAIGDVDLLVSTNGAAADTLQEWLGLYSSNTITGTRDLSSYADVNALIASAGGALSPGNDIFEITLEETRTATGPFNLSISMANAALQAGATAADQIVAEINAQMVLAGADVALGAVASVDSNGRIVITSRGSMEIDATNPAGAMGQTGLNFLGLSDNSTNPQLPTDPYFDIQVGNTAPVRITIEPGDTEVELLAKLQAVPGLAVDDINLLGGDGFLRVRPGSNYANPDFGGDIKITGGPFFADPALAQEPGIAVLSDSVNIVSALFGSYAAGPPVQDQSPVANSAYASFTDATLTTTVPFREDYLGPGASISSNISGTFSLIDFSQKIINEQTQELIVIQGLKADDDALRQVLEQQFLDESGVNLDEELGHLIQVQTAYSAAARVISAVDELFQELLNAVG